jgi:hypothetical protein
MCSKSQSPYCNCPNENSHWACIVLRSSLSFLLLYHNCLNLIILHASWFSIKWEINFYGHSRQLSKKQMTFLIKGKSLVKTFKTLWLRNWHVPLKQNLDHKTTRNYPVVFLRSALCRPIRHCIHCQQETFFIVQSAFIYWQFTVVGHQQEPDSYATAVTFKPWP